MPVQAAAWIRITPLNAIYIQQILLIMVVYSRHQCFARSLLCMSAATLLTWKLCCCYACCSCSYCPYSISKALPPSQPLPVDFKTTIPYRGKLVLSLVAWIGLYFKMFLLLILMWNSRQLPTQFSLDLYVCEFVCWYLCCLFQMKTLLCPVSKND